MEFGNAIRVLVVDDHPIVLQGMVSLLVGEPKMQVVGSAADGASCVLLSKERNPDVILLDINLPDCLGLDLIKHLKNYNPQVKIVLMTGHVLQHNMIMKAGVKADGFIKKDSSSYHIINSIFKVLNLEPPYYQEHNNTLEVLTPKEREIMELVGKGLQNKQIAELLNIKVRTVDFHISNILNKFSVDTRMEAISKWIRMKSEPKIDRA
ncbi:response regulator transcription factor [Dethiobacter alkaliphilus]|uniref:response regulator transcription factor n=1 Tax=Dethiobacter alkaliphilus TaxID=427926 RepID=UPI0022273CCB|nr:response regulator transcription factor [Dethiobacter alkaliphilus]MCW3490400.1 response regulator transcription factor [Dethiobacter alkaliphilus]